MALLSPSFPSPSDLPVYAERVYSLASNGAKRSAIAAAVGIAPTEVERVLWVAEPVFDPSLRIAPTADAVTAARDAGLRWERIAYRVGLSVATARSLYRDGSGIVPETTYAGKGRRFAETRQGTLPVGSGETYVAETRVARAILGAVGDRPVAREGAKRAAVSPALRFPPFAAARIADALRAALPAPAAPAPAPAPAKGKRARTA